MSDFLTKLGRRIRELRKQKGYSQEKLAEKADISSKYIGEIERGETNLSVSVLNEIACALDTSVADIMANDHTTNKAELLKEIEKFIRKADEITVRSIFLFIKYFCK